MKKLLSILAIASIAFVSCNSSSDAEATTEDTTAVTAPAETPAPTVDSLAAPADSTATTDSTAH